MHTAFSGTTQGGLALRIEGELDLLRLRDALSALRARHEMLNCVIETHGNKLVFVKPAQLPLPLSLLQAQHDDEWRTLLRDLNDAPLPAGTLWRVVVVASPRVSSAAPVHDILLLLHHAIMDGSAADTFFDELLASYAQPVVHASQQRQIPLPPCAEQAVPPMLQLDWDAYLAWQRSNPNPNAALLPLPHHTPVPLAARHTVFDTVSLDLAAVAAVERQAKADGSSLNSWLSAALIEAVGRQAPGRERLALHSTFSLRRLCAPRIGANDIACCMAIISTSHALPSAGLAALAREHHGALAKAVLQQSKQPRTLNLAQLRTALAPLAEASHFALDLGFTFGESRLQAQYGALRLVHLYPIVNRALGNLALAVHGVRLNGRCYFTFNHTAPLQSQQWADHVRTHFLEALNTAPSPLISTCVMEPTV